MGDSVYIHGTDSVEQERLATLNRLTNPAFVEFLELRPDSAVLEVGSGLGILAGEVAAHVPQGEVIGIDYSTEQLAAVKSYRPNLRFRQGDAQALPFEEAQFDVVYCRYLLEHVADPPQALREMRRVLKPGGQVFIQENNILVNVFYPDCPLFDAIWRQFVTLQDHLGGDALIGKKLFALLTQAGFRQIELSYAPEIHHAGSDYFHPWIDNLMHNVTGAADKLIEHKLASRAEIDAVVAELKSFQERADACAYFYWNRAQAVK